MPAVNDIFARYPLVEKFLSERNTIGLDMIGPQPLHVAEQQQKAFELIDNYGSGTPAEKEAAMIAAACIIEPPSLFYNLMGLMMDYSPEVERMAERIVGTPAGMNFSPVLAMGRAAAGAVMMDDLSEKLAAGAPLGATPDVMLNALQKSFGADSHVYSELDAPKLMKEFERARDNIYAGLKLKIDENRPRYRPKSDNFDL